MWILGRHRLGFPDEKEAANLKIQVSTPTLAVCAAPESPLRRYARTCRLATEHPAQAAERRSPAIEPSPAASPAPNAQGFRFLYTNARTGQFPGTRDGAVCSVDGDHAARSARAVRIPARGSMAEEFLMTYEVQRAGSVRVVRETFALATVLFANDVLAERHKELETYRQYRSP